MRCAEARARTRTRHCRLVTGTLTGAVLAAAACGTACASQGADEGARAPAWEVPSAVPEANAPPVPAVPAEAGLRAGDPVLVDVAGRLTLATVVEPGSGGLRVRYDGFSPPAVEDVALGRARRPYPGATAHRVGERVQVSAQGATAPATVVAVVGPDRWLVRFDAGAAYDRVVGPELLAPTLLAPTLAASARGRDGGGGPPVAGAGIGPGSEVFVGYRGAWHPAVVVDDLGAELRVRYHDERGGTSEEERVARARAIVAPPDKRADGLAYAPKELVYVEWHGMYFEGEVREKTGPGQYKVRYAGTGAGQDEIVVARRLRPRD